MIISLANCSHYLSKRQPSSKAKILKFFRLIKESPTEQVEQVIKNSNAFAKGYEKTLSQEELRILEKALDDPTSLLEHFNFLTLIRTKTVYYYFFTRVNLKDEKQALRFFSALVNEVRVFRPNTFTLNLSSEYMYSSWKEVMKTVRQELESGRFPITTLDFQGAFLNIADKIKISEGLLLRNVETNFLGPFFQGFYQMPYDLWWKERKFFSERIAAAFRSPYFKMRNSSTRGNRFGSPLDESFGSYEEGIHSASSD